jgi:SEC-C motif
LYLKTILADGANFKVVLMSQRGEMKKIRRNAPCPCGSNKKFKKCHGSLLAQESVRTPPSDSVPLEIVRKRDEIAVKRIQQAGQQGLGKPIMSVEFNGHRFVAVGDELRWSSNWKTFTDFLPDYIKSVFGKDWWLGCISKPKDELHPILLWATLTFEHQSAIKESPGEIRTSAATGAMSAYLTLAYDLYLIQHNGTLQSKLVERLKHPDQFGGARYEVFVAAALTRAGFEIEFENEDDRTTSHCEFIATHKVSNRKFSVEAKHRAGTKFRIGRQLNRALSKNAKHERLVFIDINTPDRSAVGQSSSELLERVLDDVRPFENTLVGGAQLPQTYLVISNLPHHHHLGSTRYFAGALMEGFRIPDFKYDHGFPTVRAAIESRERHQPMFDLGKSLQNHSQIPSTFDGEIPEFAFGEAQLRFLVNQQYLINFNGVERLARLTSATVDEVKQVVHCAYHFEDTDEAAFFSNRLSDAELAIWRKNSDTYFGVVSPSAKPVRDPVELYEFFMSANRNLEKRKLLEFMVGAPDKAALGLLSQAQLLREYCIRLATNAWTHVTNDAQG